MNSLNKLLSSISLIAVYTCVSSSSFAQLSASATAEVSATVVTPVSIKGETDMEIRIEKDSIKNNKRRNNARRTANTDGGQTLGKSSVSAASFTISGDRDYTYGVTMPESINLHSGGRTITLCPKAKSASGSHTLSGQGTNAISVGGSISGDQSQIVAMNTRSSSFPVTIIYN